MFATQIAGLRFLQPQSVFPSLMAEETLANVVHILLASGFFVWAGACPC